MNAAVFVFHLTLFPFWDITFHFLASIYQSHDDHTRRMSQPMIGIFLHNSFQVQNINRLPAMEFPVSFRTRRIVAIFTGIDSVCPQSDGSNPHPTSLF